MKPESADREYVWPLKKRWILEASQRSTTWPAWINHASMKFRKVVFPEGWMHH